MNDLLNIRDETRLLEEVKDILDELKMLQDVFNSQEFVETSVKAMFSRKTLAEFSTQLVFAKKRFQSMEGKAKEAEKRV